MTKFDFTPAFLSCCSLEELEELKDIICHEIAKRREAAEIFKIEIQETNLDLRDPSFNEVEDNESLIQVRACNILPSTEGIVSKEIEKKHEADESLGIESGKTNFGNEEQLATEVKVESSELQVQVRDCSVLLKRLPSNREALRNFGKSLEVELEVEKSAFSEAKIHKGEKPFQCQYCGKRFSQKCHIIEHEWIHTGEKPFKCQFCSKKFTRNVHKNEHERIHTRERPFKCQFCQKKFRCSGQLKKHSLLIHR